MQQEGRKVLVVGLGKTGLSCARFLARQGVQVAVTDSRETPPGLTAVRRELPDVALFLGRFDPAVFEHADQIVVSPGVPVSHPLIREAAARGIEVIGDIELFARALGDVPVVAVTGSNGKSTVTTLVQEMARAAGLRSRAGGNLGTPALDLLTEGKADLYVLELSSFQLESVQSLKPAAAVVLNLSPDHMDRYPGLDAYAAAKARVYQGAGVRVVNRDDPRAAALAGPGGRRILFGLEEPEGDGDYGLLSGEGGDWLARGGERLMRVSELRLPGRHNLSNALAALALGEAVGLPLPPMLDVLRRFTGLPHRCQWVAAMNGVDWYNDSKATNVGATLAAVSGFDRPLVLIAGGQGKGADFAPLREPVCSRARAVVLMGEAAGELEALFSGCTRVARAADMDEAVREAAGLARSGDAVLLSPACASFDMFEGFHDRGQRFVEAVRRYLG